MSKSSDTWIKNARFLAFGITPANDDVLQEYNKDYMEKFLVPATFMVSGKTIEEFDWDKANKLNQEALKYCSSMASPSDFNRLISTMNTITNSPAWMIYFPYLVDFYKYDGNLPTSLRSAVDTYFKTHYFGYGICDVHGTDVQIVMDSETNKPLSDYPADTYVYPASILNAYSIKHGTNTLSNILHKEWWKYTAADKELLSSLAGKLKESDFSAFETPIVYSDGRVLYVNASYVSKEIPPVQVMKLYKQLPESLIKEYENHVAAAIVYLRNHPDALTDEASIQYLDWAESVIHVEYAVSSSDLRSSIELPEFNNMDGIFAEEGVDTQEALEKAGFVTMDFDDAIVKYINDYGISPDVTISQLLAYIKSEDDAPVPQPISKDQIRAEVINEIDWDKMHNEARKSLEYDDYDKITTEHVKKQLKGEQSDDVLDVINGDMSIEDMAAKYVNKEQVITEAVAAVADLNSNYGKALLNTILGKGEKVQLGNKEFIIKALTKIGMNEDAIGRIAMAYANGVETDVTTNVPVDKFEMAGAYILHRIREHLNKDASFESRTKVMDVQYCYFRILMGEDKKLPDIIEYIVDKRDTAPAEAQDIINGALEVLQNGKL